jgi:hypothetical protein
MQVITMCGAILLLVAARIGNDLCVEVVAETGAY